MKQHIQLVLVTLTILIVAYLVGNLDAPVQAKASEPACDHFLTTGNIVVTRCVDDDGNVVFVNNVGFIAVAGN